MPELDTEHRDYTVTPIGIEFHNQLNRDAWVELGNRLGAAGRSVGFLVGDWLLYGDGKVSEGFYPKSEGGVYHDAIVITGLDYNTLARYASVCRSIPRWMRVQQLSFDHHRKVAPLKSDEDKQKWLKIAEREREKNGKTMSARRLAKSILSDRVVGVSEKTTDDNDRGRDSIYPHINRIVTFWSKLKSSGWHETTDPERIRIMAADLERVIAVYDEIRDLYNQRQGEQS